MNYRTELDSIVPPQPSTACSVAWVMSLVRGRLLLAGLVAPAVFLLGTGCASLPQSGTLVPRKGDEIVVAGQFVHTDTRVVLWMDPGGYDAYRVERRFCPIEEAGWESTKSAVPALTWPNRFGLRRSALSDAQVERVRGGGWDLPLLQKVVDQFVIHYDACGTSRQCFKVLHDLRGLSAHFLLDLDGTLYQTLDLKERAWHATTSNTRSIGIEIAHIGAYPPHHRVPLDEWYRHEAGGQTRITIPARFGDGGLRIPGFIGHAARPDPVTGRLQGRELVQYDFTPEQYAALIKLTATLCRLFPKLRCDCPRTPDGRLVDRKLPDEELERFQGVLGHLHVQTNKVDPGPAFRWDYVLESARRILRQVKRSSRADWVKGSERLLQNRGR